MEYESESTACGICGSWDRLSELTVQEQLLLGTLFKCVALQSCPSTACDLCVHRLYNFKGFLKEILLNRLKFRRTHARKMQQDPNENPDEEKEEPHTDRYNCRCSNCQKRFGSLPLLVDVIEQKEDSKTEKHANEPMPSTSHEMSPKSSRKLMKCTHCEKLFTHKGDYNKHLRKHTGEQPFTCSVCDRKFAHTSNLTRHMRLHSGDKPFTCENCNKNFSRKDKLELHRKSKSCKKTS